MGLRSIAVFAAVVGSWLLVGDMQTLISAARFDGIGFGTMAHVVADNLLLFFAGRVIKRRSTTTALG